MSRQASCTQNRLPNPRWIWCGSRWLAAAAIFFGLAIKSSAIVPWSISINTNNVIVVTNAPYNAVGDGVTTNTTAVQNAINAATLGGTTNGLTGGTVEIPPGIFMCGPLTLKKNVNLQIDAGAILRMLPFGNYPVTWFTNGGTNVYFTAANFISGSSLTNIEISGPGAIDGQGAPWWPWANTNNAVRPIMISLSGCNHELIQNVTLSNSPMFHIAIGGSAGNSTVQGVIVRAPSSSHNTDACDVSGTNILVQNCDISNGDDDFTCGGGTHDVLLTNNVYGTGHGISIGSYTDGGVSNITVVNCTINGAVNGIRIKSDAGRGGLVQNINYLNVSMTNVNMPIQVYAYYLEVGTPSGISPLMAATQTVAAVTGSTPFFRNITFSNITATSVSGYPIGIIWARTEAPATNIVFNKVNITGNRSFDLYNVSGAQFIDCNLKPSATSNTFAMFNAQAIITNSAPTNTLFTFDGLTTNGYGNSFAFYNAAGSLKNTNCFDDGPLTLAASTFTVSNNLALRPTTVLNFTPGTNAATLAVKGNLALGGTNNIAAGSGFTNGTYTLMTCTGTLGGNYPVLGSVPAGYNYSFATNVAGQVNLVVTLLPPANLVALPTNLLVNLKWNSVSGATNYNLKRGTVSGNYPTTISGLTATNYADANVTNAVSYFYVVTAVGAGGASTNSVQASTVPLPSNVPTNITAYAVGNQLQLSWPQDHLGWRLLIQTNSLAQGLSTNWATVPNSTNVMATNIPIVPTNGSVFLRLVYP
jgi:polygalacturonase